METQQLTDSTAIVTGAAGDIGGAIAERFAAEGANTVVVDIDEDEGQAMVDAITDADGEAIFINGDVTDPAEVHAIVQTVMETYGSLDILVNNAGGSTDADDNIHRIDEAIWDDNVDLNLKGPFLCSREAIPAMVESGGGALVHISSVNGIYGVANTAYSSAKGGILALSKLIATQYGLHDIRSNVICPGTITPTPGEVSGLKKDAADSEIVDEWLDQYPLNRFGRPEEIASAALYLASEEASFVTGTELVVDGGLTAGFDQTLQKLSCNIDEIPTYSS